MSQETIQDWLGAAPTYPVHPLISAASIVLAFDSLAAARAPAGQSEERRHTSAALASSDVHGCGLHANVGLSLLVDLSKGESLKAVLETANETWVGGQAGGHVKSIQPGLAEAVLILPKFMQAIQGWNFGSVAMPRQLDFAVPFEPENSSLAETPHGA